MFSSSVTISLMPEAKGGPFVFWEDLAAACEKAEAFGFDAVEIFPRSADQVDAAELRRLLDSHHLKLAAIGTGGGWVVHRLRLTDGDAGVRRGACDFAASIIDLAGTLGAPAIIGSMQGRWEAEVNHEQALAWLREAFEQLAPRAESHGMPLLFEPLNRYETNLLNRVDDSVQFLKRIGRTNVKLLCDLFHMNIEEASVPDAIRAAGSALGHLHFVDSNRQAVGFGHTEIEPIIQALRDIGYSGYLSAEVLPVPDAETAARQSMKSFRQYIAPVSNRS